MAILDSNLSRWISSYSFLILLLLHSVPYGSSQTTPSQEDHKKGNDPIIIVITVLFFIIFVMIFGSVLCRQNTTTTSFYPPRFVLESETNVDTEDTRVVRFRRTRGLESTAVESFPTFLYSEVKRVRIGNGGLECAVCLCEFEDDETLRLMPPCCHVFHSNCVDVWLSENSTCPLCRADLTHSSPRIYINSDPDPEPGGLNVTESSDAGLLDGVTWTSSNVTPRSKSTGLSLSSWRITGILFPRSHSTGHSLVQPSENLDRFTLRLPEEVRRQLMKSSMREGHVELPQARSSRRGYRSGSVGSERSVLAFGQKNVNSQRSHSLSFSFSFRSGSVRSAFGGNAEPPPKDIFRSIESGERSFERLRADEQV